MKANVPQAYSNHRSYDYLHIAITLSLVPALLIGVALFLPVFPESALMPIVKVFIVYFVLCLLVLLIKVRRYPLLLQDRIIHVEMRLRLQHLLPEDEHWQIAGLNTDQIIALHYASDEELPALVRKVLDENITNRDQIKRMITYWTPDYDRI